MNSFITNKIQNNNEFIAEELRSTREGKNLKIEKISPKININRQYLEALENGQLGKLPAGIYGKKILREYALFLGADVEYLSELWEMETANKKDQGQQNLFSHKAPHSSFFFITPKIIKNLLIALTILVCVSYLGYYLKNIISAPQLTILNPIENFTTKENSVNVSGFTEAEADVTINNLSVLIDAEGFFSQNLSLSDGLNTIVITAQKKYSRVSRETRRILVEKPVSIP